MDCKGNIHHLTDAQAEYMRALFDEHSGDAEMIPLTKKQAVKAESMPSKEKRKGYMRNQPCACGSGKKFKRCCWFKNEAT